ncbi:cytidylyltransferase domain-containing protein [Oceanihabitans sp. IOP_32]|uniref:acylneuraminate cytidylyltransferase family protein n=1 Tax=Oceanihabitans sp. IOP_32 TaxID=2529032 RepID=UPI001884A940|nr:acylneuraminate cytidylyltransferase family protein [Oceanihabitans sp. IOP_32]
MTIFLPCRLGSQRIPKKNTKDFAGVKGGLLKVKLNTLLQVSGINTIMVSTNDQEVINVAKSFNNDKIVIDVRPEHLATSETSTDEVINYIPRVIKDDHILWTHVTSPFISISTFEKAMEQYFNNDGFDSLMTVNKIQTFLWDKEKPINYDRTIEKWPRTQTLPELFEINSGFFINSRENYLKYQDRIGVKPYLYVTEGYESVDVDWPEDFQLAEMIYKQIKQK